MQPLWKPVQPQSEQRQLIPSGSFLLFLPRLFGKTILSESHSVQREILPGMKVVSMDSQEFGNYPDNQVRDRKIPQTNTART
jgi:hypothetical protein